MQDITDKIKPRLEFLTLAQDCGAVLTGKPDGSEAITVVFTVDAWRNFDIANQTIASEPVGKYIGNGFDGDLIQLYDDIEVGTELYVLPVEKQVSCNKNLKSALNTMLTFFGMDEDENNKEVFDKSREALQEDLEPYLTLSMGHGMYEVGAGTNSGIPCIAFGRNGSGKVGELITIEPRQMQVEETIAVITFANIAGIEVLQEKLNEVRSLLLATQP